MKTHAKVLDGTGKSLLVVEHEGIEIAGDPFPAVANAAVQATKFDGVGLYIVEDTTTEDSATISVINTAGTKSAVKVNGSAAITITKDNATTINVYFESDVLNVQNLSGGAVDITVKPYL